MTGAAQVLFPDKADGSLVKLDGQVVGSKLAGQVFTSPAYFHTRPSATTPPDNPSATTFANLGPNTLALKKAVDGYIADALKLERPYNPGLRVQDLPVDMVTTSASGIDPQISPANARLQANRIAKVRGVPAREGPRPDRRQHRGPLGRLPRGGRGQRPPAQPRPGPAGRSAPTPMTVSSRPRRQLFTKDIVVPAHLGVPPQAGPAGPAPQPRDVRGRGGQRHHHRDLPVATWSGAASTGCWFTGVVAFWLWLTVSSRTSPRPSPRARQGPGERPRGPRAAR